MLLNTKIYHKLLLGYYELNIFEMPWAGLDQKTTCGNRLSAKIFNYFKKGDFCCFMSIAK